MVLRKEEISTLELKEPPGTFRLGDRTPVTERIRPAQEAKSVGDDTIRTNFGQILPWLMVGSAFAMLADLFLLSVSG